MSYEIESLVVRNFLSIGNMPQTIVFNKHELTLILGSNSDDPNAKNGAGKTTILQAICYAIYGKPLTKIKIPNLVNNINGKHMSVILTARQGETAIRIERGNKPGFLRLFVNDEAFAKVREENDAGDLAVSDGDNALGKNYHTQTEIIRRFGLSLDLFRHIVGLNTFTKPFLTLDAAEQRSIVEEIFSVSILSEKAEVLGEDILATKKEIEKEQKSLETLSKANARIQFAIDQTTVKKDAWAKEHVAKLKELAVSIETLEGIDFAEQIGAFDALDDYHSKSKDFKAVAVDLTKTKKHLTENMVSIGREIETIEADLSKEQSGATVRLDREKSRKTISVAEISTTIAALGAEIEGAQRQLETPDEHNCSTCGQSLDGTDHLTKVLATIGNKMAAAKIRVDSETRKISTIEDEIRTIDAEITQTLESERTKRAQLSERMEMLLRRFSETEIDLASLVEDETKNNTLLEELGEAPSPIFDSRDDVYTAKQMHAEMLKSICDEESKENPYLSQIETMASTIEPVDYAAINDLTTLLKHQDYLKKLLTDKNSFIRKRIIDQNLAHLNKRLSFYLDKLGLPHKVRFQTDLTADITKIGVDYDYEQLSRGEMCRVNMATALSFRDVWESMNHSINLLWIDELLDQGLDTLGVNNALGVIKTIARNGKSVFLISHREELISRIDRVMHVVKVDDFTTFTM